MIAQKALLQIKKPNNRLRVICTVNSAVELASWVCQIKFIFCYDKWNRIQWGLLRSAASAGLSVLIKPCALGKNFQLEERNWVQSNSIRLTHPDRHRNQTRESNKRIRLRAKVTDRCESFAIVILSNCQPVELPAWRISTATSYKFSRGSNYLRESRFVFRPPSLAMCRIASII